MHFDFGHVAHPQYLVVVEVRLLERPVLHGAPLLQRVREAEEQRALDLRAGAVGVDDDAAVHRADDLPTFTAPLAGSTCASTTLAVHVGDFRSCAVTQATPRPTLGGSGESHPARSAASFSTRASRGAPPSIARRNCTGSALARWASSSMNVSTAKNV